MDEATLGIAAMVLGGVELRVAVHRYAKATRRLEARVAALEHGRAPPALDQLPMSSTKWRVPLPDPRKSLGLFLAVAALALSGCFKGSSHREGQRRTVQHVHLVGGVGALAVDLVVDLDGHEATAEDEKHEAHVDAAAIAAAVATALKAAAGTATGGLGAHVPELVGGATALAAAIAAAVHARGARREVDDAWDSERAAAIERAHMAGQLAAADAPLATTKITEG